MVNLENISDTKKNSHISGILNADCFFSIVLSHVEKCSFPEINKLRYSLQHTFPHVVIDLSGSAVQDAVTYYSAYYSFSDGIVKRKVPGEKLGLGFMKQEFSSEVSWSVIEAVNQCVKESINP